jgi:hypothetical protein
VWHFVTGWVFLQIALFLSLVAEGFKKKAKHWITFGGTGVPPPVSVGSVSAVYRGLQKILKLNK